MPAGLLARLLAVATVALAPLLAACGDSGLDPRDINLFTLDDEWQLGDQLHAEIAAQVELADDPAVTSYVGEIGRDVADQTQLAGREWSFHVVRDPAVNAFALPGGHIYVHTGLLTAVRSEAELAGVLAHEVAHVEARHTTEALTRAYGIDTLLSLLGQEGAGLDQIAVDVLARGAVATFSRSAEREADELGVAHLAAAGYPPEGLPSFFEVLLAEQDRRPTVVERFFGTHPLTEERLAATRELANDVEPTPPLEEAEGPGLAEVQQGLEPAG